MKEKFGVYKQMYFTIPVRKLYKKFNDKNFVQKVKKGKSHKYVIKRIFKKLLIFLHERIVCSKSAFTSFTNYCKGSENLLNLYGFFTSKVSLTFIISNFYSKNSPKCGT